jgi:RNA polymerase sigma-70 factor (ECF subfamily)
MSKGDTRHNTGFVGHAYHKHELDLRRYLMRRLSNAQDVRELAQEVWTRLLRIEDPDQVSDPVAYIRRAAANVLAEFYMRRSRERALFVADPPDQIDSNPALATPDDLMERMSTQQQLQRMLSRLPAMYRTILLMRLCDGASYSEIGASVGLSPGTAERYFFRAMNTVRSGQWK